MKAIEEIEKLLTGLVMVDPLHTDEDGGITAIRMIDEATEAIELLIAEARVGTFTKKQLIAWAEEQKTWADSVWNKDLTGAEGYERALDHLTHYVNNPITEII